MHRTGHRAIAALAGLAATGALSLVVGSPLLPIVVGVEVGVAVALFFRITREHPAYWTGDGWRDSRWTGLSTGLLTLGALLGVSPLLAVADGVRFGLGLLVLASGFVAYLCGMLSVVERDSSARE